MSLHPYFDFDVLRNVTARVGQTAFLHCRVEQLGDKSVSTKRIYINIFFVQKYIGKLFKGLLFLLSFYIKYAMKS